jgi:predicted flavoprotein YhiN
MSEGRYDAIVIGGGPNGLLSAALDLGVPESPTDEVLWVAHNTNERRLSTKTSQLVLADRERGRSAPRG